MNVVCFFPGKTTRPGAELVHGSPPILERAVLAKSQLSYGRRNLQLQGDDLGDAVRLVPEDGQW